jgi:lysophospholipase L1-like esterase
MICRLDCVATTGQQRRIRQILRGLAILDEVHPLIKSILPAALFCQATFAAPADSFYLHPGDKVVFYGDSITDQRLYTMVTELFVVTRYPKLDVRFIHSGWGGDRVGGGGGGLIDVRLQRDVLAYHPTVMTIMLGMNDGHYTSHTVADDETYYAGYRHLVEVVRQAVPSLRITAIEPSPFDDVTRPFTLQPAGYNAVLQSYSAWIEHYAGEAHLDVADLNAPVVAMLRKANSDDAATALKILPDRVHPALAGHMVMAEQLLKAWHARPLVSSVTLDAAAGKVTNTKFASVSDFKMAPLSWTESDEALPLPFAAWLADDRDHSIALAIKSSDITEALNQEPLRVTGLAEGRYKLTIDGVVVGTWGRKDLADGVNLAVLDTPMARQSVEVRDLTARRIEIHQQRWRTLQVPLEKMNLETLDTSLRALDALDAELATRQHTAAQPRRHAFQLDLAQ